MGSLLDGSGVLERKPSGRNVLKWCRALAAVWILGIALGFSGNLLIGPSVNNSAAIAPKAITTSPPTTITSKIPSAQRETSSPNARVESTIQVAHVVSSVSVKSTHVEQVILHSSSESNAVQSQKGRSNLEDPHLKTN